MKKILCNVWPSILFFCFPLTIVLGYNLLLSYFELKGKWIVDLLSCVYAVLLFSSFFWIPALVSWKLTKAKSHKIKLFILFWFLFLIAYLVYWALVGSVFVTIAD